MKNEDNKKIPKTITLPELNIEDFIPKQVVYEIPVVAFNKKIMYILTKSSNNKLVAGIK